MPSGFSGVAGSFRAFMAASSTVTESIASPAAMREQVESRVGRADWWGMVLSIGCAIHCLAMPMLITFMPVLGFAGCEQPWIHQVAFLACLLVALPAVHSGYKKHRRLGVGVLAGLGLACLFAGAFVIPPSCCDADAVSLTGAQTIGETENFFRKAITPAGGFLLVAAHMMNFRSSRGRDCECECETCS